MASQTASVEVSSLEIFIDTEAPAQLYALMCSLTHVFNILNIHGLIIFLDCIMFNMFIDTEVSS